MDIREEMIRFLYSTISNEELYEELQKTLESAADLCEKYFPREKEDDYMDALVTLEYEAFRTGVNMILDVISGKHIEK